jgi:hypothetical protein
MNVIQHDTPSGHPNEDDLVLLYYGDIDAAEEAALTAHVDACALCQPVWQEIRVALRAVDAAAVPEPPADFERVMWARVQGELDGIAAAQTSWWAPRHWVPAGAFAVMLMAVFVLGRMGPGVVPGGTPGNSPAHATAAAASQSERALLVAMGDHLERSELLLVEVMNAPTEDVIRAGFEPETADDLLWSSRLYRQTATHTGNVQLAAMLEDLEAVLVEVARSPRALKRQDLNALRSQIKQDDLIFKVRVVTGEVRERQKTLVTASEGDR